MFTVEEQTGVKPILYINCYYAGYLGESVHQYDLWIANYHTPTCDSTESPCGGKYNWDFWQYYDPRSCGKNSVPGISSDASVDLNIFNGDMNKLNTFKI